MSGAKRRASARRASARPRAAARASAALCAFAVTLGACGDDEPERPPSTAAAPPPAAAPPAPHPELDGPYFDGAISDISDTRVTLHLLPERPGRSEVTFVVPQPPPPGVDLEHLRGDAAGGRNTRIFYRRKGGRYILRGYAHPPAP